jgi:hypothetical protein
MNEATHRFVRQRAGDRCEYRCLRQIHSPLARLQIEHIVPIKHGGNDSLDNLALACTDCNLHKGPNRTGIDPESGAVTELFHPRLDNWDAHFSWSGVRLVGLTATGRTTIAVLDINTPEHIEHRLEVGSP